jgi:hypothetical protein
MVYSFNRSERGVLSGVEAVTSEQRMPRHVRKLSAFLLLLIALTSAAVGCATIDCRAEARRTVPVADAKAFEAARTKCEKRVVDAQHALRKQEAAHDAEERRDRFRSRNEDQPR